MNGLKLIIYTAVLLLIRSYNHHPPFNKTPRHPGVCDGIGARPSMYHEYHEDECPAANHLNSDGICGSWRGRSADTQCTKFCQIRTFFEWAQESPIPNSECRWPVACSISPGDVTSWHWGTSVHPTIKHALESGISGGYGDSHATSTGHYLSVDLREGECGYFTFVPIRKTTCGTLIKAQERFSNGRRICWHPVVNIKDYCASQVSYANGVPDGRVLFIRTDCLTRERLGLEFQHPIYSKPGVALNPWQLATLQQSWVKHIYLTYVIAETTDKQNLSFTVQGKGFSDEKLGTDGANLNTKIAGCGSLHDWKFEWTPDNGAYHWAATGTVLGTAVRPCIGKAIAAIRGTTTVFPTQ